MPYVKFTKHLNRFFPDLAAGPVPGETVADVIRALDAQHPGLAGYLLEDHGALRQHVNIFLGEHLIADRQALSDPVRNDDRLYIFQALSGG